MLIKASARHRQPTQSEGPSQLTLSDERRSSLPAWVGLGLASLFAYFKQWIDGTATPALGHETPMPHADAAPHEAAMGVASHASLAVAQLADDPEADRPTPHHVRSHPHRALHEFGPAELQRALHIAFSPARFPAADQNVTGGETPTFGQQYPSVPSAPYLPRLGDVPVATAVAPAASNTPPARSTSKPAPEPTKPSGTTETPPPASPDKTNRAPTTSGPVTLNGVTAGSTLLVGLGDLLLGASDADGDTLAIQNIHVSAGSLEATAAGWLYHAPQGAETLVTLSYDVSDGTDVVAQTANVRVLSAAHILTDGDDVFVGSQGADQIDARDGNDLIDARGGNDLVLGGAGNDHLLLGDGDDVAYGGAGHDVIFGGFGNDILVGGDGDDRLFGEAGDDTIFGNAGNDFLSGGDGNDHLDGGIGRDTLLGDAGDDVLDGGEDDDVVDGGSGDDLVIAGAGNDRLAGGEGHDTLDFSAATSRVVVDLVGGTADGADTGHDEISGFEVIVGGSGDDLFCLGVDDVELAGGAGDDTYIIDALENGHSSAPHYEITDFAVGDRIVVGEYSLAERSNSGAPPDFETVYDDTAPAPPIRVADERFDDVDMTVVTVTNAEDLTEYSIWLHGQHDLLITHPITG